MAETVASNTVQYKQVYSTSQYPLSDGNYYYISYVPQDAKIELPMTDIPIPDDLIGKVPKFDLINNCWIDSNKDPIAVGLKNLSDMGGTTAAQLATMSLQIMMLQQQVGVLTALVNGSVKPVPSTTSTTTTPASTASTTQEPTSSSTSSTTTSASAASQSASASTTTTSNSTVSTTQAPTSNSASSTTTSDSADSQSDSASTTTTSNSNSSSK